MKREKRLIKIYAALAAVGVVLIAAALFMNRKSFIFHNYENMAYRFKVEYPLDWAMKENFQGAVVIFLSPETGALDVLKESVNIAVQDLPNRIPLKEFSMTSMDQMRAVFKGRLQIHEQGDTTLGGEYAHRFIYSARYNDADIKYLSVWTIVDGRRAIQLTYTATESQFDQFIDEAERIIESFQFI